MNYTEFKEKQEADFAKFTSDKVFYAFDNNQFNDGLKKLNTTKEEILSLGYGGFLLKSERQNYIDFNENQNKEADEFLKNEDNLFRAFKYQLANHEFYITGDYEDALNALGFRFEDLNEKQIEILKNAKNQYLKEIE